MIKNKHYHFFYKTTNMINEKYYYGIHSTKNLNDKYLGSGKYLRNSIRKYGEQNFKIEILEFFENREALLEKEKSFINEKLLLEENCMNLRPGGFGGFSSKEQSENAKKSNIKQKWLKENDFEWFQKKCKNISIGNKKSYEEGREIKYFYDWNGKYHSEETKKKIGEKNSIKQKGQLNSQYGTCWVFFEEDKKSIKIKKEVLNNYLLKGWKKGRK